MIARVLRSHGYRVVEARDGVDALSLHDEGRLPRLNLVVTDLVMPRMGGEELVAALRGRFSTIPVLLVSGFDERGSANNMIDRGEAAALLEKPFEAELLLEKVRELLDLPARANYENAV
jgi:CheY-like chemotaxis protein